MKGIKAGYYELKGPMNLSALRHELLSGKAAQSKPLTMIEGWTKWHIADLLELYHIVDRKAFLNEIQWEESRGNLIEGKLFPDTYRFPLHAQPKEIIQIFLKRFHQKWKTVADEFPNRIDLMNQDYQDKIVKIASLVERESSLASERKYKLVVTGFQNPDQRAKLFAKKTTLKEEQYFEMRQMLVRAGIIK